MNFPKPASLAQISPWALWLAALAAAIAYTGFAFSGLYPPGDVTIARAVQSLELPGLNVISEAIYHVGLAPVFLTVATGIAVLLLWRGHRLAAGFLVLAVAARSLSPVLKGIVERPRPESPLVDVTEQANGFSFPSGHVLGTVLLLGFVIYLAQEIPNRTARMAVQVSSAIVIGLMGLQRVYAGAHWPTDVIAGYLWGGVVLFVLVQAYSFCVGCNWRRLAHRITGRLAARPDAGG